jgi:hypothetical protein
MNQEEYLEKLITDFGDINGYSNEEKKEFLEMLKLLLELNDSESNLEDIINLIIKKR